MPVLVSTVAVFVLSSILHMVVPWHKSDYPKLPNQDAAMDAIRALNLPDGEYMAPRPESRADMQSPEFAAKMERGPLFILNVAAGRKFSMAGPLGWWFVYCLVVSWVAGHIAQGAHLMRGNDHEIFHSVGLAAWLGYSAALWQNSIWWRKPVVVTLKSTIDGLIYAAATAYIFTWLWPS
jgi:hypothetical protein